MAYEHEFSVEATGDIDTIMTAIGEQLHRASANTDEIQCGFALAAVDEIALAHSETGNAVAALEDMFEVMRDYFRTISPS